MSYTANSQINVRHKGAKGDGTTNDTAAIQAAIDAAATLGEGIVFFPAGTYIINAALNISSRVQLLGVAASFTTNGSTIKQTSTTLDAFRATNTTTGITNVTIKNLRIEGPGSGSGNGIYLKNTGNAGSHPPFTYWNLENVYITGFGGYGFNAESLIVSTLTTVIVESCTNGFYLNGGADGDYSTVNTSITFLNCYANGCTTIGYNVRQSTYISFSSTATDSCGTGHVIDGSNSITFVGSGCEYGNPDSASPGDAWKITNDSAQVGLYNCYSYQNKHYAVWVTGASTGVTLVGFQENSPVGATNSFKIDSGSRVTVIDNSGLTTAISNAGMMTTLDAGGDVHHYRARGATLNRWYSSAVTGVAATTIAPSVNTLRATPFVVSKVTTIEQMALNVTAAGASSNIRVGIYADNGNMYPGALVVDAGSVATATTGVKTYTTGLPVVLSPGLYWLACVGNGTAPTIRAIAATGILPVLGLDSGLGTAWGTGWSVAFTFAALPANFTSGGAIQSGGQPGIFFRASV